VSDQTIAKPSSKLEDFFTVRSDKLKQLRVVIRSWKASSAVIGSAAQFRLVVDSNVILGDIIWLSSKRTNELATTHLMEVIEAETVDMYAPPILFDEVEEKIPIIAAEKGLDQHLMYGHWEVYKTKLKIFVPDQDKVSVLRNGVDPDDAEFVALEQTIGASGVISKNSDIRLMGGNQISVECITYLRNYSRAAAIEMNIKVNGVMFAQLNYAAIAGMFAGGKALIEGVAKAPDWVKIALLVGVAAVALHPGAREKIVQGLKSVLEGISEATPFVIEEIAAAIALVQRHKAEAQYHLDNAMKELGRNEALTIEHKVNT